ncbi:MAG: urease accessory protein UreD [Alkalilacustris sp.]
MFDDPSPVMQRSRGRAAVRLVAGGAGTCLAGLEQAGSAKAFLPKVHGAVPEVVFLNTSGGLTGGDVLRWSLALGPGAAAVGASQTAERAYAARGPAAEVEVALEVGTGGALDWLPQETILYDRARLARRTRVEMAGDARLVWAEMLVLGRAAMGERVAELAFRDRREIWRGGRLALLEPVRMDGAVQGPALTGGARALASVVLMAPGAEDALAAVRAVLPEGVEAGASAWDGRVVVRVLAAEGLAMKRAVAAVLAVMRRGAALPRVWQV